MRNNKGAARKKRKWYEQYLPFVAKSPEMQIDWLVQAFRKGVLSPQEITPYIRLLLAVEDEEARQRLAGLFQALDEGVIDRMIAAADIYDVPELFGLIAAPVTAQAVAALKKAPPLYEKAPQLVLDRVFQSIHNRSARLLEDAAATLRNSGEAPPHFEKAYNRFLEVLEDEKFLSTLYPKAKIDFEAAAAAIPSAEKPEE